MIRPFSEEPQNNALYCLYTVCPQDSKGQILNQSEFRIYMIFNKKSTSP
uniref:Uncharacterized protein n=1 Tax=Anguilla anguilla TaxID=7936 RepID=A0A0E9Q891_ANGAN